MPRVGFEGFEPTTPVFERAKTVHALDRAAIVIGKFSFNINNRLLLRDLITNTDTKMKTL
jgi:hypothetical protein